MVLLDFDIQETPVDNLKASVWDCKEPKTEQWVNSDVVYLKCQQLGVQKNWEIRRYGTIRDKVIKNRMFTKKNWKITYQVCKNSCRFLPEKNKQ